MQKYYNIVTLLSPTIEGFWISNRIYLALTPVTINNYESLNELHTPKITVTTANKMFSVFTNRCLIVASAADVPLPLVSELFPASATSFSLLLRARVRITL
jgi:hypothetical protein